MTRISFIGVIQVGHFHLKEVRSVVDEGHQVTLVGHREGAVEDLIEYVMWKCSRH
jgi:hypothetical protein